ncbi:hypothetical protein D9758_010107 [Tetrapyrgos nigripes]|uniref:RING-type domain-containing protein n=1 Tax=Tetrapyrgos nigripes TaxID=182062 RepID=A0A8H5FSC7_9AGAR|nr:hypothetical protein D9758_010107 [Tetrapyrgos nigripes]
MDQNISTIAEPRATEQIDQISDNPSRLSCHLDACADASSSSSYPLPHRLQWAVERLKQLSTELEPDQLVVVLPKIRKLVERANQTNGLDLSEFDEFRQLLGRLVTIKERRSKIPVVRYLPCSSDLPPSEVNGPASPEWLAMFVHSDLPSVCIEDHNACCNICLEDFEEPPLALELQVDGGDDVDLMIGGDGTQARPKPLRQLQCRHVLHEECLPMFRGDYNSTFECPACRTKVWTPLSEPFSLLSAEIPRYAARNSVSNQQQSYDDYYDSLSLPPWQKIPQDLLNWAAGLCTSELDEALYSTTRGRRINELAMNIWANQTYKRYVHSRMTDNHAGIVDCFFVDLEMARMISNSISSGEYRRAGRILRESWDIFGLQGAPRLLVVFAKHISEYRDRWVVHKFSLPDGGLTAYHFSPKLRTLRAGRPAELWWNVFHLAWPDAAICSISRMPKPKLVPVRPSMQLPVDDSVAAVGVWRNILTGLPVKHDLDLEHLRDLIHTEVNSLCQRYNSWVSYLLTILGDLSSRYERVEGDGLDL